MKPLLTFVIILLFNISALAQVDLSDWDSIRKDPNLGSFLFVQYKFHFGVHAYTGKTFHDYLQETVYEHELRLGWRTVGNETWTRALNYPLYGVGIYTADLGDEKYLGRPWAAYGFIQLPIMWRPRHHFSADLATGLTFNLKPYNETTNPHNDAIGADVSLYFSASIGGDLVISNAVDFTYGFGLTHYSNGRISSPNYGLNIFDVNMGLRYNFNPIYHKTKKIDARFKPSRRPEFIRAPLGAKPKGHEINLLFAGAPVVYQFSLDETRYPAWTAFLEYHYRYGHIGGVTAGFDWFYDGSQEVFYNEPDSIFNVSTLEKMYAGLHLGHSLYIHNFNLETQGGWYVYKPADYKGNWYMRFALKYHFSKRFFANVGLKTLNGGGADWAEFGIGYKLFSSQLRKQKRER